MPDPPHVLFLRSNPIDPDPRVEKSAAALAGAGYIVSVLGWDRTSRLDKEITVGGVGITRLGIRANYGTGLRNLPALIRWQWGCLIWLIRHRRDINIIHACDFDTLIPALILKLFWKKVVVYDIFDFYADHLRLTPNWIKKIVRYLETKSINWVDGVILVDDERRSQIAGSNPRNLVVVYNTPQDFYQQLKGEEEKKDNQGFTIVYVGLLQIERGLLEVIDVMKKHPEWKMDLAGFGGDEVALRIQAEELDNVRWHGRISYTRALELSSQADVLFATYDPAIPNHRYASPNKVFEAMMLGIPIIGARGTNVDKIIEKHNCGLVIEYGIIDELDKALTTLYESPELRSWLGNNGREAYKSVFNWAEMESRLLNFYTSIQPVNLNA